MMILIELLEKLFHQVHDNTQSPEEIELAEILLDIHKWADQVKCKNWRRNDGFAIRLAERIQKRKIMICGYHGWHDWYLATNIE